MKENKRLKLGTVEVYASGRAYDFDRDNPEIALEIIADSVTQNRERSDLLCLFMRETWKKSDQLRRSFKRSRDKRSVVFMWFDHWNKGENKNPDGCNLN